MRLVDADVLIEGYKQMGYDATEHPEESYMEGWCKGFNSAVDHCTHHVIHAPTIEERKKGEWIIKPAPDKYHCGLMVCSECGFEDVADAGYKYCPVCGARNVMEGNT